MLLVVFCFRHGRWSDTFVFIEFRVANFKFRVSSCKLRVEIFEFRVANFELRVANVFIQLLKVVGFFPPCAGELNKNQYPGQPRYSSKCHYVIDYIYSSQKIRFSSDVTKTHEFVWYYSRVCVLFMHIRTATREKGSLGKTLKLFIFYYILAEHAFLDALFFVSYNFWKEFDDYFLTIYNTNKLSEINFIPHIYILTS